MSNLISCTHWVPRGVPKQHPDKYNLDETELERVSALARIEIEDVRVQLQKASEAAKKMGNSAGDDEVEGDDEGDWEE